MDKKEIKIIFKMLSLLLYMGIKILEKEYGKKDNVYMFSYNSYRKIVEEYLEIVK